MSDRDNITLPREVARLALSYIEWYIENEDGGRFVQVREAEAILRTALAAEPTKQEAKQEPVAYFDLQKQVFYWARPTMIDVPMTIALEPLPLYAAPPDAEALRRDAERYRWLRDKAPPDIGDMASVRDSHDPSEIDAAIDAAMENKR